MPVTGIVVNESRVGTLSAPFPTELGVGEQATRVFTSTITLDDAANGNVDNIATVSGTATVGGSPSTVSDTFDTTIDGQGCPFDPYEAIQITKTCPVIDKDAGVGDEITYDVTITNKGDVLLTNIVVDEDRAGTFDSAWPASLAPDTSATRTFTSTITLDDAANGNVDNHVTVTADATSGETTVHVTADLTATARSTRWRGSRSPRPARSSRMAPAWARDHLQRHHHQHR